jgi:hypothetical protein
VAAILVPHPVKGTPQGQASSIDKASYLIIIICGQLFNMRVFCTKEEARGYI